MDAAQPIASPRMVWAAAVALALLSCLPFLVAVHPQLTDYPSHLARYHVMLDGERSPFLAQYYEFRWLLAGNIGADLLMVPLGHALGVERAGWLLGAVIPPLTGLGLIAVVWALRRRVGAEVLLALALVWSPALGMGFYNFCLSLVLALFAFAAWVWLGGRPWRWAVFLPVGLIVWLCHASGWGVLGVLVFGYEWSRTKGIRALGAPWPLLAPLAPMLLAGGAAGGLSFGHDVATYKSAIWLRALRDQSMVLDVGVLALVLGVLTVALLRRRIDGRLGWAALILGALTIAMPRHFGGGDFADYRLIAVALMIGCLAIDWPRVPRAVLIVAALPFLLRLTATTLAWHSQSRELEEDLRALAHVPQGARIAGAVAVDPSQWGLNPFEHAPSYATVCRDALVNSHFAIPGIHMLQLKGGGPGFVDPSQRIFHQPGQLIDLAAFPPARRAEYLWFFGPVEAVRPPPGARVLYRAPRSILLRLAKRTIAR